MKKLLFALFLLIPRMASAQGQILPDFMQQYSDALGVPVASGFVCTTISGTTTNLASYPTAADAVAGTNANTNPVTLDSAGRGSIFMGSGTYRAVLLNPLGVGSSSCNGHATGSAIKTVDGLAGGGSAIVVPVINNVRYCNAFAGGDAGAKIANAINNLPSTGGMVYCLLEGGQAISSTVTVDKPITLILGATTYTTSANPAFTVNAPMTVLGAGTGITVFQQSGTSSNVFNVASTGAFGLYNTTIQSLSSQVSGAGVTLTGVGMVGNGNSVIKDNVFSGQWIAIDSGNAAGMWITQNQFQATQSRSVRINNTVNGDSGDNFITLNKFAGPGISYIAGTAAIELIAGGGLMVDNNKFFLHDSGILVNWNTSANTSQLSINNNHFESMKASAGGSTILLARTAGTLAGVTIMGNYMSASDHNVLDVPANGTLWMSQLVVANNNIPMGGNAIAFNVTGYAGAQGIFTGNHVFGNGAGSQGFNFGANLASMKVWGNEVLGTSVDDVFTSGLRGNYEPDKTGFGISEFVGLTNRVEIPNNEALGTYSCTLVMSACTTNLAHKLIYEDQLDNVTIAANNQPIVTGTGAATFQGTVSSIHYKTDTSCVTNASPALCMGITAGTVGIPTSGTTLVVDTTAVTANSEIFVQMDTAHNIGSTCNTGTSLAAQYYVSAISPGVSFTITTTVMPVTDPACVSFLIVN